MDKTEENLHLEIAKIQEELKCSFFDAVLEFCVRADVSPDDIVKNMDKITITRIQQSAIEENMVRKKDIKNGPKPLKLE